MNARIDHLVVVADTLAQGAAWCEAMFGAAPEAGGRHALMGTHNCVLAIGSAAFPNCYLEIIAIDPDAPAPPRPRWFAMDDATLRHAVRQQPRWVHAAARTQMIEMQRWGLINCGLNPGTLVAAQRDTANGRLRWRITVRDDGRTECAGALPTLIEWQGPHPCDGLRPSPVALRELVLRGLPAQAAAVLQLAAAQTSNEPGAALSATFDTPRGCVQIHSWQAAPRPNGAAEGTP